MRHIIFISFTLIITSCQNQNEQNKSVDSISKEKVTQDSIAHAERNDKDSIELKKELLKQIEELAKPVYVEAYTVIHTLRSEVELAKKGTIPKSGVVRHFNETVGRTMGRRSTLEQVDKRLQEAGDAYIEFMF